MEGSHFLGCVTSKQHCSSTFFTLFALIFLLKINDLKKSVQFAMKFELQLFPYFTSDFGQICIKMHKLALFCI